MSDDLEERLDDLQDGVVDAADRMADRTNDDLEAGEWQAVEPGEVVVVDGAQEIPADRYRYDDQGQAWLQAPGEWTRGPMDPSRVEIETGSEDGAEGSDR